MGLGGVDELLAKAMHLAVHEPYFSLLNLKKEPLPLSLLSPLFHQEPRRRRHSADTGHALRMREEQPHLFSRGTRLLAREADLIPDVKSVI